MRAPPPIGLPRRRGSVDSCGGSCGFGGVLSILRSTSSSSGCEISMNDPRIEFNNARGSAMDAYSDLERSVAGVLRATLDISLDAAWTIAFSVVNTRSRYSIISSLMKISPWSDYLKTWDKLQRWLGPIDSMRNSIAHWIMMDDGTVSEPNRPQYLYNPRNLPCRDNSSRVSIEDVNEFIGKPRDLSIIIRLFGINLHEDTPREYLEPYLQLPTYQNPAAFLESQIPTGFSSPRKSSPQ